MELKNQVVSLELAKKLKELGVKQESLFYWRLAYCVFGGFEGGVFLGGGGEFGDYRIEYLPKPRYTTADVKWNERDLSYLCETEVSAFTVAELGEMLPDDYSASYKLGDDWNIYDHAESIDEDAHWESSNTEADARAKMLIYLLENNLTK